MATYKYALRSENFNNATAPLERFHILLHIAKGFLTNFFYYMQATRYSNHFSCPRLMRAIHMVCFLWQNCQQKLNVGLFEDDSKP